MVQQKQCILIVPAYYHFTACRHHFALFIGLPTKSVHVSWYDIFLFEVFTFFKLATSSRFPPPPTFCNKLQLVVTKWPPWAWGCCTLTTNFNWLQGNCTSCLIGSNLSANVKKINVTSCLRRRQQMCGFQPFPQLIPEWSQTVCM